VVFDHAKNEGHDGSRNEHHEHWVVERTDEELRRAKADKTQTVRESAGVVRYANYNIASLLAYRDEPGHWRFGHLVVSVDLATFL